MDQVNEIWNWLMSRGPVEYIAIVIALGLIIWEILYLISKWRESKKNGRNDRNNRNDRR